MRKLTMTNRMKPVCVMIKKLSHLENKELCESFYYPYIINDYAYR